MNVCAANDLVLRPFKRLPVDNGFMRVVNVVHRQLTVVDALFLADMIGDKRLL